MRKALAWTFAVLLLLPAPTWSADGETIEINAATPFQTRTWIMLDASTGENDGVWVSWEGFILGQLHTDGINSDTIQVRGSNADAQPDNSTDGAQVGSDITADGFTTITGPYRWLKVKHSTDGSGTVTAILTASTSGGGGGSASSGSVTISGNPAVVGTKSNNAAAPSTTNVGALTSVATASAPSYTEGNLVAPSTDLGGKTRVYVPDSGETNYSKLSTASTNATAITSSVVIVTGIDCQTPDTASAAYLHVYTASTAPVPSTDTFYKIGTWDIGAAPASGQRGGFVKEFVNGLGGFTQGLAFTITGNSDDTQSTIPAASIRCNIQYHGKQS
jgi:hypothetical protein